MATTPTVKAVDFLNKPMNEVIPSYNMGTVNLPVAPKTDIKAFNQQMVNAQPGQTNFNIPTVGATNSNLPSNNVNTSTNNTGTINDVSGLLNKRAVEEDNYGAYLKGQADTTVPTEAEAQAQALRNMQAEINVTNTLYADKLRRAQTLGAGYLGESRAVQARRGLLGSDFGTAQTQNVNAANEDIYSDIENEKLLKISQIQSKAKTDATAALAEKRAAKEAGVKNYVEWMRQERTSKEKNLNDTVQTMLANKTSYTDLTDKAIADLVESYGFSKEEIKSKYNQALASQTATAKKLAAEEAKAGRVTVTEGQRVYQIDPVTGAYKEVAYNPKTFAPKAKTSGGGGTLGGVSTGSYVNGTAPKITDQSILAEAAGRNAKTITGVIPNTPRGNQVKIAMQQENDENAAKVANDMLAAVERLLANPENVKAAVGSVEGYAPGIRGFFSQGASDANADFQTLRALGIANNIEAFKYLRPFSNVDLSTVANASTLLSQTKSEEVILESLRKMKNELEPARQLQNPTNSYMGTKAAENLQKTDSGYAIGENVEVNGVQYRVIDDAGNLEEI